MPTAPIEGEYERDADEHRLRFRAGERTVEVVQPRHGYGMLAVRVPGRGSLESYYGLEMALDHVAELLGVVPDELVVPAAADEMGL